MSAEEKIVAHLSSSTEVSDRVSGRIYPLVLPQGAAAFPVLVYQRIAGSRVNALSGYTGTENPHFQVDSVAETYSAAKALAAAVSSVMQDSTSYIALLVDDLDSFETEVGLYRVIQEFSVWNKE